MENRAVTFPQMYGKSSEQADMPSAPSQNASERELHVIIGKCTVETKRR